MNLLDWFTLPLEYTKESVIQYSLPSYNCSDISHSKSSDPTSTRSDRIQQWMDTLLDGLSSAITTPSDYMDQRLKIGASTANFHSMDHVPIVNSSSVSFWNYFNPLSSGVLSALGRR